MRFNQYPSCLARGIVQLKKIRIMAWTKESALKHVQQNPYYEDFLAGQCRALGVNVSGLHLWIFAEETGISAYLRQEYPRRAVEENVYAFLDCIIPALSAILNEAKQQRLCTQYCISPRYI